MSRPLSILFGSDYPPDPNLGAPGTVVQMQRALERAGNSVDSFWGGHLRHRIRHGNLHFLLELPREIRRGVRSRQDQRLFDVIEINQPQGYLAAVDHRRQNRPGIFLIRSQGHEVRAEEAMKCWQARYPGPRRSRLRRLATHLLQPHLDRQWDVAVRAADGFIFSCHDDADFLKRRYQVDADRVGVIPMGIPTASLETPICPMRADRLKRILYIAQFAYFKAPMVLSEALSQVLRKRPDVSVTWVCNGTHHEQARTLLDPAVHRQVQFRDWMPQDELTELFDTHGVFPFPSFFEGFGKAPLEAMARGLCVVASDTGGMCDFISHDRNGLLVPVGDVAALAASTLRVIEDLELATRLSSAARAAAREFSWERCARDAADFYRRLLDMKQSNRTPTANRTS